MSSKLLIFTTLIFAAFVNTNTLYSQTCKIKTGTLHNGTSVYTEVYEYDFVDVKPEFPGGSTQLLNFVNSTREYPQSAYEMGIEGRVTCSFIVNSDGKISHIKVLKGVESSLNQEAIRIIASMPDWQPGRINSQNVPVRVITCIPFRR